MVHNHSSSALRLSRHGDGCAEHAQHYYAHSARPAPQHCVLPDEYLRDNRCHRQGVRGVRRGHAARTHAATADAPDIQPAGRNIVRCGYDFPFGQPGNHLACARQALRKLLQEISVHLAHQLRYGVRYGSARHRVHGESGLLCRTVHRSARCVLRLRLLHATDAALRAESLSAVCYGGRGVEGGHRRGGEGGKRERGEDRVHTSAQRHARRRTQRRGGGHSHHPGRAHHLYVRDDIHVRRGCRRFIHGCCLPGCGAAAVAG